MKGQTKKHSFTEAIANVVVGFFVSIVGQLLIFPLVGIPANWHQNLQIAGLFTILSILRTYLLRRYFNKLMVFMHLKENKDGIEQHHPLQRG